MGVNKVVYGGNTLIDLSADTVAANKMLAGITGHDKAGNPITGNIPSQAAQTITPGTDDKTIAAGKYLSGTQTIKGDANLVAGNIAKDVTIFGVTGTHEGGEDVSAETAEYTSLLTDLETAIDALPDAGSGGESGNDGSVETCTITFSTTTSNAAPRCIVTRYVDGQIVCTSNEFRNGQPVQYTDIICGSLFFAYDPDWICINAYYSDNIVLFDDVALSYPEKFHAIAPLSSGAVGTIEFE